MANLTSQQANDLANQFLLLTQSIEDFRHTHWDKLTSIQHQKLAAEQNTLMNDGENMLALSTRLVMNEVETSLASIKEITVHITGTLGTLEDVQKGINIIAAIVMLGSAIVSLDPLAVESSIEDLLTNWKTIT